jgi:hypothetical protein
MIFTHPQNRQIRAFQGHGLVGISFTGQHPNFVFLFVLLLGTIDSDILYNVDV